MLRLRAGVAALKKGIGMGQSDPRGVKLPHAATATDAASIQHRLALLIHVRTCLNGLCAHHMTCLGASNQPTWSMARSAQHSFCAA